MNYVKILEVLNIPKIPNNAKICTTVINCTNSRQLNTVFIEKCLKSPIIVIPESNNIDIIGPPNSISNLRPVIRQRLLKETYLQQKLRKLQNETEAWNEIFWTKHNSKFIKEKEDYIKKMKVVTKTLSPDEMSEFYKQFLDVNWRTHVQYNF